MVRHNPCTYKAVCKKCNLVSIDDRPTFCSGLECENYTPCSECGKNLNLKNKICKYCLKTEKSKLVVDTSNANDIAASDLDSQIESPELSVDELPEDFSFDDHIGGSSSIKAEDVGVVTRPGEPLPHYSDDLKDYYSKQWKEYSGYYSDPTAYYIVHQIIILEIELSVVSSTLSKFLSDDSIAPKLEKRRDKLIANLKSLRSQLPQKDALELSDDEKSMSMVYDKYLKEKKKNSFGSDRLRRILTPDAFALAPILHYNIDPVELLIKLGYEVPDPEKLRKLIEVPPEDPLDAAEFFGFRPKEKFAMEVSRKFEDFYDEEDKEDETDDGIVV